MKTKIYLKFGGKLLIKINYNPCQVPNKYMIAASLYRAIKHKVYYFWGLLKPEELRVHYNLIVNTRYYYENTYSLNKLAPKKYYIDMP